MCGLFYKLRLNNRTHDLSTQVTAAKVYLLQQPLLPSGHIRSRVPWMRAEKATNTCISLLLTLGGGEFFIDFTSLVFNTLSLQLIMKSLEFTMSK